MKPCLIAHIHCTKTTYLVRTSMWEKSIGLPDTPTFNGWKNKNPKVDPYLRVKKISNMHWEPVKSQQRKTKRMPWLQLLQDKSRKKFWQSIRKNKKTWLSYTVGDKTGNEAGSHYHVETHFAALLNSSKNCEMGNFVKQNITSCGNSEEIDDLTCNSYKIKSLLHKLPLDHKAGKDGIFPEHIFYADASVCVITSVACLMHEKTKTQKWTPIWE